MNRFSVQLSRLIYRFDATFSEASRIHQWPDTNEIIELQVA